jgi:hypothetical protein
MPTVAGLSKRSFTFPRTLAGGLVENQSVIATATVFRKSGSALNAGNGKVRTQCPPTGSLSTIDVTDCVPQTKVSTRGVGCGELGGGRLTGSASNVAFRAGVRAIGDGIVVQLISGRRTTAHIRSPLIGACRCNRPTLILPVRKCSAEPKWLPFALRWVRRFTQVSKNLTNVYGLGGQRLVLGPSWDTRNTPARVKRWADQQRISSKLQIWRFVAARPLFEPARGERASTRWMDGKHAVASWRASSGFRSKPSLPDIVLIC